MTVFEVLKIVKKMFADRTSGDFCSCYEGDLDDNYPETVKEFLEELETKLKEHDSTADNIKPEQSINQKQMMSQIEDIEDLLQCVSHISEKFLKYELCKAGRRIPKERYDDLYNKLKDCFVMYFKTDSKPVKISDDKSITDEELVSKIEDMMKEGLVVNVNEQVCGIEDVACEIVNYFKETYLKQNFKPSKFSD